jgi:hypothetical protein
MFWTQFSLLALCLISQLTFAAPTARRKPLTPDEVKKRLEEKMSNQIKATDRSIKAENPPPDPENEAEIKASKNEKEDLENEKFDPDEPDDDREDIADTSEAAPGEKTADGKPSKPEEKPKGTLQTVQGFGDIKVNPGEGSPLIQFPGRPEGNKKSK